MFKVSALIVNALNHDWQNKTDAVGRSLLWIFPLSELIGQAPNKLKLERVAAIVILPKWIRYWQPMIDEPRVVDSQDLKLPHNGSHSP